MGDWIAIRSGMLRWASMVTITLITSTGSTITPTV
jgi:hypothetical protein